MIKDIYARLEKELGGLKFGITLIILFALALTIGTFIESYNGTEYANRVMYKSWPFMLLQFFMFLCIFMATLLRFPAKRRLYGFYVLHAGLLLIFIGAFVTFHAGIDGSITLKPMNPTREIVLPEDQIVIITKEGDEEKKFTFDLPNTPYKKNLNINWKGIQFGEYYPYSDNSMEWKRSKRKDVYSVNFRLANDRFAEEVILSLDPESDYQSNIKMGLLSIHAMPEELGPCFGLNDKNGFIIWNFKTKECFTPDQRKIKTLTTKQKTRFLAFKDKQGEVIKFFPDFSPIPLDDDFKPVAQSTYRIFSKKVFEGKPHLFVFGKYIGFFDKDEKKWFAENFDEPSKIIDLPWMGFNLKLNEYKKNEYPIQRPYYVKPIQDNNQIIKGEQRAIEVSLGGSSYWLKSGAPLNLRMMGKTLSFYLTKKTLTLPFELALTNFKMNKDPGTNNPASYESFVNLFNSDGTTKHHIFMNNPLKYDRFTLYQASYFKDDKTGQFGSVLSVNYDPGRALKYFGSLLLVMGATWHFYLRRKTKKTLESA